MPVALKVIEASETEPLLTVRLDLDPQRIAELILRSIFRDSLP
ncbi:AraC family transcriptional regulator N-terminal domain-containing protein [Desulfosporosinus meridiei]